MGAMGDSCPTPPVGLAFTLFLSLSLFLSVNEGWERGGAWVTSVSGCVTFLRREGVGGWFNELLKRTQTLVNSLRAGEPSCLALGPEVNDPVFHPERDPGRKREKENHQKLQQITIWYMSLLVCGRGQSKASKISKSFSFSLHP